MSSDQRMRTMLDVVGAILFAPFTLAGIGWLILVTEPTVLILQAPKLLLILALLALLNRVTFFIIVEFELGRYVDLAHGLDELFLWSAALIFGPHALWVGILNNLFYFLTKWPHSDQPAARWSRMRNLILNLMVSTLTYLPALGLYQALGGTFPLPSAAWRFVGPALAATGLRTLLDWGVWTGYLFLFSRLFYPTAVAIPRSKMFHFWSVAIALPALAAPFAVLGAVLFALAGWAWYLFFAAGLVLVSLLAHRLSQAAERSRQQTQILEKLEALSRELLAGPPDGSELESALGHHVPYMFVMATTEIQVWDGYDGASTRTPRRMLLFPLDARPIPEAFWEWLRTTRGMTRVDRGDWLPWDPGQEAVYPWLAAPVMAIGDGDRVIGGICLRWRRPMPVLNPTRVLNLEPVVLTLADQIASTLHRAYAYKETLALQRMEGELRVAGQIQASFLPEELPELTGWDLVAVLKPARQASGDFYDFILLPEGLLGVVIADVADKGVGAALFMALSRTLIRTYALQNPGSPGLALEAANRRILQDTRSDQFVTVFYGILNPATGKWTYTNAGHNPPLLVTVDGQAHWLSRTGMALGVQEEVELGEQSRDLCAGDVLVLYTDGLTDAQNRDREFFGNAQLQAVVKSALSGGGATLAGGIQDLILHRLADFVAGAAQFDDITLITIVHRGGGD